MNLPPQHIEAEQVLIGTVMVHADAFAKVADKITASDFYRRDHQLIWSAITRLADRNQAIDAISVSDAMAAQDLEDIGGRGALGQLSMQAGAAGNGWNYARIIRDKSRRRQMMAAANQIAADACDGDDADKVLADAQSALMQIGADTSSGPVLVRDAMVGWIDELERRSKSAGGVTGLATGYRDLDERTTGLHEGNLVVVAGRPGMGKTSFGIGITAGCVKQGKTALVFSMEMSVQEIVERAVSAESHVGLGEIRSAKMDHEQWTDISKGADTVGHWPLYVDETPALAIAQIKARSRRIKAKHGLDLIVVDYMSLAQGNGENRTNQVGDVSRGLKALAKELRVPVVALSQLNRGVENRQNKRPMMADLRESGQVEQDADLIVFLYRDEVYNEQSDDKGLAEIIIGKQRNGTTGTFPMVFLGETASFVDAAPGTQLRAKAENVAKKGGGDFEQF